MAGCANNQCETLTDCVRLKNQGIIYVPDFVINAGGVIHAVAAIRKGGYEVNRKWACEKTNNIARYVVELYKKEQTLHTPMAVIAHYEVLEKMKTLKEGKKI